LYATIAGLPAGDTATLVVRASGVVPAGEAPPGCRVSAHSYTCTVTANGDFGPFHMFAIHVGVPFYTWQATFDVTLDGSDSGSDTDTSNNHDELP